MACRSATSSQCSLPIGITLWMHSNNADSSSFKYFFTPPRLLPVALPEFLAVAAPEEAALDEVVADIPESLGAAVDVAGPLAPLAAIAGPETLGAVVTPETLVVVVVLERLASAVLLEPIAPAKLEELVAVETLLLTN